MEKNDISSIVVILDQNMAELKRQTRSMHMDNGKITQIVLEMRWQLAQALTCIGKMDDKN